MAGASGKGSGFAMPGAAPRTVAVVLAGGAGQRLGASPPKQLLEIGGRTIIEHSIAAFDSSPDVDEVLVVMVPGFAADIERIVAEGGYGKVSRVLDGGATRAESTYLALSALDAAESAGRAGPGAGDEADCRVLLHDAVRPLVTHRIIGACAEALATYEAVTVAVPAADTVLEVDGDVVVGVPRRTALRRAQTPQGFRLSTIRAAYDRAVADPDFGATDDTAVVLRYLPDVPIQVVPGSSDNIKVTHPGDIVLAEELLRPSGDGGPGGAAAGPGGTPRRAQQASGEA